MEYFVYMLLCADNTIYTGVARDVLLRLKKHQLGMGAKYTRGRGPLKLMYCERLADKSTALKREHEIKKLTRVAKLALVQQTENIVVEFNEHTV